MPLDTNQFEVIGDDKPQASPDQFEVIGDAKPAALDLSKVGLDPYEKYRLAIAHGATPESYSELPQFAGQPFSPSNPDMDYLAATRGETILAPIFATAAKGVGELEKRMPIPARYLLTGKDLSKNADNAEAEKFPFTPYVNLPKVSKEDMRNLSPLEQRIASGANALNQTLEEFSSPVSASKLPVGEGMTLPFALQIAESIPGQIKDIKDAPDANARTAAATRLGASLAMGGLLAKGHLGKEPTPEVQGPYALGRMLNTPRGAEPELRVEDFEPLDTQSGTPLSPQELIARQSRAPVVPAPPDPPAKTFEINEEGEPENASKIPSTASVSKSEVRPPVGEGTPLRQQGETSATQSKANEPEPRAGDARGAANTDEKIASESTESIVSRTKVGEERDAAFKNRADAISRVSKSLKPGDVIVDSDGVRRVVRDVHKDGTLFVDREGGTDKTGGEFHFEPEMTIERKSPSQISDAEAVSKMTPNEFAQALSASGKQATHAGYELAQQIKTPEDRAQIKKFEDDANNDTKALLTKLKQAKTPTEQSQAFLEIQNANVKKQFFNEAGRLYDALEEVKKTGDTAAAAKKFGVDESFVKEPNREFVGMGGATPAEFESGAGAGREIYGIAHEVRKARAKAGVVEPVERGEGITRDEAVERGRQLLNSGADPEAAMKDFETNRKISADGIALARAQGEKLAREARIAERQFGTESKEYEAAYKRSSDWEARSKAMQTEWNRAGMAQQGATDIDTGSFTGLRREFQDQTGKDFNPKQKKEAKEIADKVNDAADKTEIARNELFSELDKDLSGMNDAEKRAIDAANKTVREAAVRRAEAEKEQRVTEAQAKNDVEKVQREAARKAKSAADKTVREDAIRKAKEESQQRVDAANKKRQLAEVELARSKRARDAVNKQARDAAAKRAQEARKELGKSISERAWDKAREYIEAGVTNFDDIRNKLATDLGLSVDKVTTELARTKRAKYLTDNLWKKQQDYRRLDQQAKRWLAQQQMPWLSKQLQKIPDIMFGAKVFGHGTVALGTHAPMVAFQPRFWGDYVKNFADMYRMSISNSLKPGEFQKSAAAFYEKKMQDLVRRPNYITARRAGLVNDPFEYEDYNAPNVTRFLGPFGKMGDRGYSVLKLLRQDMFDQYWNNLPKTQQIPDVAKAIADGVNHATGVIRSAPPRYSNIALFAPRLALSRGSWLVADPLRAVKTGLDWKNASDADKIFAMNQVKEKAWVVGTMLSLLALNEGFLEATGSNQRVNVSDPMKRDWMKFKVAGLNVGYGNAMLAMARLPARLYRIRESDGGKLKNLVYPDEDTYSVLGEYGRSQLSPFASLASTLWFKSDWQNRPLPNSNRPIPKRLAARGVGAYTWPEFWTEQALPIPLEEGAREVWKSGLGMTDEQQRQARKALATISVMMATGARVEDDTDVASPENH